MRRNQVVAGICGALFVAASASWGADAKVSDLLAKIPAQGMAEGQEAVTEIVKLGPAGITELCKMLAEHMHQFFRGINNEHNMPLIHLRKKLI